MASVLWEKASTRPRRRQGVKALGELGRPQRLAGGLYGVRLGEKASTRWEVVPGRRHFARARGEKSGSAGKAGGE
jgi:hypothetical protein